MPDKLPDGAEQPRACKRANRRERNKAQDIPFSQAERFAFAQPNDDNKNNAEDRRDGIHCDGVAVYVDKGQHTKSFHLTRRQRGCAGGKALVGLQYLQEICFKQIKLILHYRYTNHPQCVPSFRFCIRASNGYLCLHCQASES